MMEDVLQRGEHRPDQTTLAAKERAKEKMTIRAPFEGEYRSYMRTPATSLTRAPRSWP